MRATKEGITDHGGDLSIPKPFGIEQRFIHAMSKLRHFTGDGVSQFLGHRDTGALVVSGVFGRDWAVVFALAHDRRDSYLEAAAARKWNGGMPGGLRGGAQPASLGNSLSGVCTQIAFPEVSLRMMEKREDVSCLFVGEVKNEQG